MSHSVRMVISVIHQGTTTQDTDECNSFSLHRTCTHAVLPAVSKQEQISNVLMEWEANITEQKLQSLFQRMDPQ